MGGGFLTIPNSIKSSFKIEKQKIKLKMNFEVGVANIQKLNKFNSKICGIDKRMKSNI